MRIFVTFFTQRPILVLDIVFAHFAIDRMLFRRNKPTPVAVPVALIAPAANKDAGQTHQYAVNSFAQPPKTFEEILSISTQVLGASPNKPDSPVKEHAIATPLRALQPQRGPGSRKTGHATIYTDATSEHEAFESDAFAVHMPTTRIPIMDYPIAPKRTTPIAQAEAFRTYQEKAHQVRARNLSTGVRIPSKIMSYDYASPNTAKKSNQPPTPPEPAGTFPISPPITQTRLERPPKVIHIQTSPRKMSGPRLVDTTRKPGNHVFFPQARSPNRNDSQAGASPSTPSPTRPAPITIRITPRVSIPEGRTVQNQTENKTTLCNRRSPTISPPTSRSSSPTKSMPNFTRHNSVEGDSLFGYQAKRRAGTTVGAGKTAGAGSSSGSDKEKEKERVKVPKKLEKPKKAEKVEKQEKAFKEEKQEKVEKEEKLEKAEKLDDSDKSDKNETPIQVNNVSPKRTLGSRWPWPRPSAPRKAKPAPEPTAMSNVTPKAAPTNLTSKTSPPNTTPKTASANTAPRASVYVSPFDRHATPPLPTSPRNPTISRPRLTRKAAPATASVPQGRFETGCGEIKQLAYILCKIFFVLYALVALWYVLDTVRELFHAVGAPFRLLRMLGGFMWLCVLWLAKLVVGIWERCGFKVAVKESGIWSLKS